MTTPFGPRLIGETEKTLNALLRQILRDPGQILQGAGQILQDPGLTEPQWVTMRLADLSDGAVGTEGLVAAVADRAHFGDAAEVVAHLTDRGLLDDGRPTATGRELIATVQATIATRTAPIWDGLPADDVAATTRVLNEVVARARVALR